MSIAIFHSGEPELEVYGVRLLNRVSALLRGAIEFQPLSFLPLGPDFNYDLAPRLFQSRRGRGPLHIAWDTNLLIDYFQHGRALWDDEPLPDELGDYGDELEALQLILAVWVIRDVRFHVVPRVLVDAKRKLTEQRLVERTLALDRFAAALRLVESGEPDADAPSRDGLLILPQAELRRRLENVPDSDRALVQDAVEVGAHIFLTRDRGVLACRDHLLAFGLFIASPADLLEELARCGALHCFFAPEYAYWPLPDQARVAHLIRALPPASVRA